MTCISRPFALLVRWQNTSRLTMLLPVYQIQDAEFARLPCEIGAVAGREAWSHEDPSISASISASLSTRSLISALATRRIAGQCALVFSSVQLKRSRNCPARSPSSATCWPSTSGSPQRRNCSLSRKLQAFSCHRTNRHHPPTRCPARSATDESKYRPHPRLSALWNECLTTSSDTVEKSLFFATSVTLGSSRIRFIV